VNVMYVVCVCVQSVSDMCTSSNIITAKLKMGYKVSIFVRLWALLEKLSIHQQLQSVAQRLERMYWSCFIGAQRHYL
jgi:hypothetical protein